MAAFAIASTAPKSTFVQLSPYLLAEYIYDAILLNKDIYKVQSLIDGSVTLINDDPALRFTGNTRDVTVLNSSDTLVVETDVENLPEYLLYTDKYQTTSLSIGQQKYDKIRFHIQTGFDFNDIDGIRLTVKVSERSGKQLTLLSTLLSRENSVDRILYHAKPLFVRDRLFDKYFDVRILSTYEMNSDFYALEGTPNQNQSLAALVCSNTDGLLRQTPVSIELSELNGYFRGGEDDKTDATFGFYYAYPKKKISVKQSDDHNLLGATIQENQDGFDYFEFFGTWDGAFIEDYILYMNSTQGYSYILMHEIKIYEQIDDEFTLSSSFNSVQEAGYDLPQIFRPVLLFSDVSTSFSIDYTMRLFNKQDGTQIVRAASIGSYDVHKWGRKLMMLDVGDLARPYKIYNKLVTSSVLTNLGSLEPLPSLNKSGHIYFDRSEIEINTVGFASFSVTLTPFDNIVSLLVKDELFGNLITTGNTTFQLVFTFNEGDSKRFARIADSDLQTQTGGNMVFKILAIDAKELLKKFSNILSVFLIALADKTETVIAQGKVFDFLLNTPNAPTLPPFSSQLSSFRNAGSNYSGGVGIRFIEYDEVPTSIISQIKPDSI